GGVFKSTNGGASWSPVNTGLDYSYNYALAIDPSNTTTLYASPGTQVIAPTSCSSVTEEAIAFQVQIQPLKQMLQIGDSIAAPLEDFDLVVEAFDEAA